MPVTREQFIAHVQVPLQSTARPSSPTKSTYRVRWRQLCEWENFVADARAYWDGLASTEKGSVLVGVPENCWDEVTRTLAVLAPTVSQEPHLGTPFSLLYSAPHNTAITGAGDAHARITTQLPENTVGQPDACLEYNNQLAGVVELKSFWNLTEMTILEVLRGTLTSCTGLIFV